MQEGHPNNCLFTVDAGIMGGWGARVPNKRIYSEPTNGILHTPTHTYTRLLRARNLYIHTVLVLFQKNGFPLFRLFSSIELQPKIAGASREDVPLWPSLCPSVPFRPPQYP